MPCASPRYSPVGSRLSVKPKFASQPTLRVPPRWILSALRPDWVEWAAEPAAAATIAQTATARKAAPSLRVGLFTSVLSFRDSLPPAVAPRSAADAVTD